MNLQERVCLQLLPRIGAVAWATFVFGWLSFNVAQTSAAQPRTTPGRAEVRALTGTATWSTNGGPVIPLKVGTVLFSGSVLTTGTNSTVDLFLGASAGVIRVAESSKLSLDSLKLTDTGADTKVEVELDLPDGEMYFNVNKLSKASRYEIKMPTGVAGIRGTRGSFNSRPNSDKPRILLLEGTVVLAHTTPSGQMVTLTLKAPPPVTFEPKEGVKEAPPEMVNKTVVEVESVTKSTPPPKQNPTPRQTRQRYDPVMTQH